MTTSNSADLDLANIKACVFDAYGTLFDVHSAVGKHRAKLGDKADQVSMTWRTKQLEYTWLRSLMRVYADFWEVTGNALDYSLETHGINNPALREELMQAYLQLSAYDEVPGVLAALVAGGYKTAILSNGSPLMLNSAIDGAGLRESLHESFSVDSLRIYKPDPSVYQLVTDSFGISPSEVMFQSSNAWDAAGAASFGFRVLWVNRFGQSPERLPARPDFESKDLNRLLELLGVNGQASS